MAQYTAIRKGYKLVVTYDDGSKGEYEFKQYSQAINYLATYEFPEAFATVNIQPVWSKPGESVPLEVKQNGEAD